MARREVMEDDFVVRSDATSEDLNRYLEQLALEVRETRHQLHSLLKDFKGRYRSLENRLEAILIRQVQILSHLDKKSISVEQVINLSKLNSHLDLIERKELWK